VLIVEDDVDARTLASVGLQRFGYESIEAATLAEARVLASKRRPDIVVLDCRLPDGDGLELARMWAADPSMREVPIVVLTGFSARQDLEAALLAGADLFLVKPLSAAVLAAQLDRVLRGARPSQTLRARS
jgi:DNA-binding response OmpR family regulator